MPLSSASHRYSTCRLDTILLYYHDQRFIPGSSLIFIPLHPYPLFEILNSVSSWYLETFIEILSPFALSWLPACLTLATSGHETWVGAKWFKFFGLLVCNGVSEIFCLC